MKQRRLQAFLYILLRDEVPFGSVENIMKEHVGDFESFSYGGDEDLAKYAGTLASRILGDGSK